MHAEPDNDNWRLEMNDLYKKLGVHIPEILLPADGTDLTKWAVIACDQYTSQPEYWDGVQREVGQEPSTFKLTFPEIYLKDDDKDERIANINKTMEQYLNQGILEKQTPGFILVERSTPHTASRKGLMLALDLECYDYRPGAQTLIRATEGTVLDRIPPRVKIRENATIELPHIMVLIDDPDRTVIESLYTKAEAGSFKKLYDFELMQGGGHIKGWKVDDEESLSMVARALDKLEHGVCSCKDDSIGDGSHISHISHNSGGPDNSDGPDNFDGSDTSDTSDASDASDNAGRNLLFAVGDGNHSLASAKAHWENVKAELMKTNQADISADQNTTCAPIPEHPARYALVEIVNVHDDGLVFEPIHRVLFNIDAATILEKLKAACSNQLCMDYKLYDSKEDMEQALETTKSATDTISSAVSGTVSAPVSATISSASHLLPFILEGRCGILTVTNPSSNIEVGTLQSVLDELQKTDPDIEIDYIHGDAVVTELGSKPNSMGFYLPVMNKHDLFPTVRLDGVLPRKTFSMGEAEEKRYYLECRRIR